MLVPERGMQRPPEMLNLQDPKRSRLKRMVPSVGSFFTPMRLVDAFKEYDEFFALSRRRFVHPNFAELRHVLNIAQVTAAMSSNHLYGQTKEHKC